MSKITIENYQEFARRPLNKDHDSIAERSSKKVNINWLPVAFGLVTEYKGLVEAIEKNDITSIKEKLGNVFWFLALLIGSSFTSIFKKLHKKHHNDNEVPRLKKLITSLRQDSIELSGHFKYYAFYDKNKSCNEINCSYINICEIIYKLCKHYNLDMEDILQTNIDKLKASYPEKFTEDKAQNRDLKKERELLENGKSN